MIYSITISIILIGIVIYQAKRNAKLKGQVKSFERDNTTLFGTLRAESKLSVGQINDLLKEINPDDINPNKYIDRLRKGFGKTGTS